MPHRVAKYLHQIEYQIRPECHQNELNRRSFGEAGEEVMPALSEAIAEYEGHQKSSKYLDHILLFICIGGVVRSPETRPIG